MISLLNRANASLVVASGRSNNQHDITMPNAKIKLSDLTGIRKTAFFEKVEKMPNGCWMWGASRNRFGYGVFSLGNKTVLAHRVSFLIHFSELPLEMCVLHKCDTPPCVNPDHLFLGTQLDNATDRDNKGRRIPAFGDNHGFRKHPECVPRGTDKPNARLDDEKVFQMRLLAKRGVSQAEVARRFKVSLSAARSAMLGFSWRHVLNP